MASLRRVSRLVPVALAALLACGEPSGGSLEPVFGKAATGPTVTATAPDTAVQDTTLDVQISGSGFDVGSTAQWLLAGVADTTVTTNSTRYLSRSSLVANITIKRNAVPASYDVAVTTSTGKKGIGTELFVIEARDPTAIFDVSDAAGMGVTSDGRGPYVGGTCGVNANIFVGNGSGDAVMQPYKNTQNSSALCDGVPRAINVNLGSLGVRTVFSTNVAGVDHLAVPNSRLQDFGMAMNGDKKTCERVKYDAEVGGQILVTATGLDALGRRTWVAESQAPHFAGCYISRAGTLRWDGVQRIIPFRWTITEVVAQ